VSHAADTRRALEPVIAALNGIVLGKDRQVRLALACLLARGHLLIEDLPGVGKTTLAQALARALGLSYQRVQFTSDLLPADVIGVSVYDRDSGRFEFHRGPVFAQLLLADEVNRATPKAQSALLEAMEERQVTVDGHTHPLPEPFFVVATQNPSYQLGTYPLPESQLDRFLMRIELGYPSVELERELLRGRDRRQLLAGLEPLLDAATLKALQQHVPAVHVAEPLLDYVQALVRHTRASGHFEAGLSPRAAIALLRASQAWALLHGRPGVVPEDVQAVLRAVAGHRLELRTAVDGSHAANLDRLLLEAVAVP
jgi:MoxR-like ATPase